MRDTVVRDIKQQRSIFHHYKISNFIVTHSQKNPTAKVVTYVEHHLDVPACIFVSGISQTSRDCGDKTTYFWSGCESANFFGVKANVCVCNTDLCNGAVMTSSVGHVIVVVALVISVITGYLM